MTKSELRQVITDFLSFVSSSGGLIQDREARLMQHLDSLAFASYFSEYEFDDREFPVPPRGNPEVAKTTIKQNFADLGFYHFVENPKDFTKQPEVLVGDAADDLLDIYQDLTNVQWCWTNTSDLDALWHFRFGFKNHWGAHLRGLQAYLVSKSD